MSWMGKSSYVFRRDVIMTFVRHDRFSCDLTRRLGLGLLGLVPLILLFIVSRVGKVRRSGSLGLSGGMAYPASILSP
jgi:hypothetical protein